MPVSLRDARCTFFDGPPRVVGLGFQLRNGELVGLHGNEPADLFDDVAFNEARRKAMEIADYMRRHGEIAPALLGPEELEYTGIVKIMERIKGRFRKVT
jgi:fructose 1,6-bisphosphate aldolase/phosphatase